MPFVFFRCLGRTILKNAPRALLGCLPFGETLHDIARDTMEEWRQRRPAAQERRAELECVATATPDHVRELAEAAAAEVTQSPDERKALAGYMERMQGVIRRSLTRPEDMNGRTVPAGLPLDQAEDLVRFLLARPPRYRPGDRVAGNYGREYKLVELVGVGGFGEVWRAVALHEPGCEVAVKVSLDPDAAKTLKTEASLLRRILAQGSARGLVPLRDACLTADPPFVVYDYVSGGDLTRLIQGWHPNGHRPGRLNDEATRLVHHLSDSLRVAHDLKPSVVHRDLKPSNILLEPTRPGRVRPRVADFGIGGIAAVQAITRLSATSQKELLTTGLRGARTDLYASPQQKEGEPPDPRDDIYALGVIWYQVLVGDTTIAPQTDWQDELEDREVPKPALDVLGRCLSSDPKRRPADAAALARLLRPLLRTSRGSLVVCDRTGHEQP